MQLAALALPSDPHSLALVPLSSAMEQEEPITVRRWLMTEVQLRYAFDRRFEKLVVVRRMLRGSVGPIREQGEADVAVLAREIVDLQALDLLRESVRRRQQSRNHDHFFFSSRRRHTRSDRDWSSDVCSSD